MTGFYRFTLAVLRPILTFLFLLRKKNEERIPRDRNLILVSNHISAWDPFLAVIAGNFYLRPLAKTELFQKPPVGFLLRKLGCIEVDRLDGVRAAILSKQALLRGETILIFPEGTRSKTGELQEIKGGAAALAIATNTAVLPLQVIAPKGVRLFSGVEVRFGSMILPEELHFGSNDKRYEQASQVIKNAFLKLRDETTDDGLPA